MILSDMSDARRMDAVAVALDITLRELAAPSATADVVNAVMARLDTRENRLVARLVLKLAESRPEAQRSVVSVKRYGREMSPWVWSPTRAADDRNAEKVARLAAGYREGAETFKASADQIKAAETLTEPPLTWVAHLTRAGRSPNAPADLKDLADALIEPDVRAHLTKALLEWRAEQVFTVHPEDEEE